MALNVACHARSPAPVLGPALHPQR